MSNYSGSTNSRCEQTAAAAGATPLWSNPAGNPWAYWRELSKHRSLQLFLPGDFKFGRVPKFGEARFYFAPGELAGKYVKKNFAILRNHLENPSEYPTNIELEFSSPRERSVPNAYRSSAINWALSVCDEILICIDRKRGAVEGEAHRVLAPLQAVFRCQEEDVPQWVDYLEAKTFGRHRLSVIHPHIAVGRA